MSTFNYNGIDYTILTSTTCQVDSNPSASGSITIPDVAVNTGTSYTVVSIVNSAFYSCTGLTSVDLSACTSITSIGFATFIGCSNLETVSFPPYLTSIGIAAFRNCSNLETVSFPASLTSIGSDAFAFTGLTSADLSACSSLTSIGDNAFTITGLTSVNLTQCTSLISIGNGIFQNCIGLTSVTFPASLISIGDNAFQSCSGLTSVNLSNTSLTSIGNGIFQNCIGLISVTFPASLTSIGISSFQSCTGLTSVNLSNTSLTSIGNNTFNDCTNLETVIFPASLTSIGNEAFLGCSNLETVSFTASLTSIGNGAFGNCSSLKTLYFYGNPLPTIQSDSFQSIAPGAIAYVSTPAYNNLANQATITSLEAQGIEVVIQCFLKGSKILTDKGYTPIEYLRKGDLVKTLKDDYQPIYRIGKKQLYHGASQERWKNQLYVCKKEKYPELLEELIITGCHSILVDEFISAEEREKTIEVNGDTYVTDGKYRLPACVDERTEVYPVEGTYEIYHLALEHSDKYMNYGIYANGLLVETCSKRYLTELSEMEEVL